MKKYKSIFTESIKKYEFTIPTWAVNYIENGDVGDISEKEQKQIDMFLDKITKKYGNGHWSWPDDSYFGVNEINAVRSEVFDAVYVVIK